MTNVYSLKNIDEAREYEAMLRKNLADKAGACDYFWLAETANSLAAIQGAINVFTMVELLDKNNATTLERIEELTNLISYGADDSGSGRGNDARRCFQDGVRQVSSRQLQKLYRSADKEFYPEEVEY